MECEICVANFDLHGRRPKVMACGHTACLSCIQQLPQRRCPKCRREFLCAPVDLGTNFALLNIIESSVSDWCKDCSEVAKAGCADVHDVCSAGSALQREVEGLRLPGAGQLRQLAESVPQEQAVAALSVLGAAAAAQAPTLRLTVHRERGSELVADWKLDDQRPGEAEDNGLLDCAVRGLMLALAKRGLLQEGTQEGDAADVSQISLLKLSGDSEAKEALIANVSTQKVRKLSTLYCKSDPSWSLRLLRAAAPHVEELRVEDVTHDHLAVILSMPRLRRLAVAGYVKTQGDRATRGGVHTEVPRLIQARSLERLELAGLPEALTFSFLKAVSGSLVKLILHVGGQAYYNYAEELDPLDDGFDHDVWPTGYTRLGNALWSSGFAGGPLRKILLHRDPAFHNECKSQVSCVKYRLPMLTVLCNICDKIEAAAF